MTLEERFEALDRLVRRLEDALEVEAAMASRHRDRHEQWLRDHEQRIKEHDDWLRDHQLVMEAHNAAMREVDNKLDRIADMLRFRGGNGGG